MEWLKPLIGCRVGLDSAPLIYFIEKNPLYLQLVQPFFEAVERGDIEIVTSLLTLTEVLVHPLRRGDQMLAQQYSRILLNASHVRTLAISPELPSRRPFFVRVGGTKHRTQFNSPLRRPLMLKFFITNDEALNNASGLQVMVLNKLHTLT